MDAESLQNYCNKKKGAAESFPFGDETLVFKVKGKVFMMLSLDAEPLRFNAKCDPEEAVELREQYDAVMPGYHMNKDLWNTVIVDGSLSAAQLKKMIDNSYDLVIASLSKKIQQDLKSK